MTAREDVRPLLRWLRDQTLDLERMEAELVGWFKEWHEAGRRIRDPGKGFDPGDIPSPLIGQNLFAGHGRGVYLIHQLMDDVRFEKAGTEIWIVKR